MLILAGDTPAICPIIVSRIEWGGRVPTEIDYSQIQVEFVIIHHTAAIFPNASSCTTERNCIEVLRNIQKFHMDELNFNDIGYKYVLAEL